MAESFNVGDTVRLKSGGPRMTVESLEQFDGMDTVSCVWFDEKNEVQRQTFPADIVEIR